MLWPEHETQDAEANLVQIYVTSGLYQAEIIRGKLETNGIPVLLKYESLGPVIGLTLDGLGQVQVWVPANVEAQARELLTEDDLPVEEDEEESDNGEE